MGLNAGWKEHLIRWALRNQTIFQDRCHAVSCYGGGGDTAAGIGPGLDSEKYGGSLSRRARVVEPKRAVRQTKTGTPRHRKVREYSESKSGWCTAYTCYPVAAAAAAAAAVAAATAAAVTAPPTPRERFARTCLLPAPTHTKNNDNCCDTDTELIRILDTPPHMVEHRLCNTCWSDRDFA